MTYSPSVTCLIERQVLKKNLFLYLIKDPFHPEAFMNDKRVLLIFDFQVIILFESILQLLFKKFKSNLYLNKSGVLWYPPKRKKVEFASKIHPLHYEGLQQIAYLITLLIVNKLCILYRLAIVHLTITLLTM